MLTVLNLSASSLKERHGYSAGEVDLMERVNEMTRFIKPEDWQPSDRIRLEDAALRVVTSAGNNSVIAGPGAGKTELLAQRAFFLLQTGLCKPPQRILAISFKRDAAKTLKDRVTTRCTPEQARRFELLHIRRFR